MNQKREKDKIEEKFEVILARLEEIVEKMESGGLGLEEAMKLYEEGISKAGTLNSMLTSAREKVMKLSVKNGEAALEKFEPEENV